MDHNVRCDSANFCVFDKLMPICSNACQVPLQCSLVYYTLFHCKSESKLTSFVLAHLTFNLESLGVVKGRYHWRYFYFTSPQITPRYSSLTYYACCKVFFCCCGYRRKKNFVHPVSVHSCKSRCSFRSATWPPSWMSGACRHCTTSSTAVDTLAPSPCPLPLLPPLPEPQDVIMGILI